MFILFTNFVPQSSTNAESDMFRPATLTCKERSAAAIARAAARWAENANGSPPRMQLLVVVGQTKVSMYLKISSLPSK